MFLKWPLCLIKNNIAVFFNNFILDTIKNLKNCVMYAEFEPKFTHHTSTSSYRCKYRVGVKQKIRMLIDHRANSDRANKNQNSRYLFRVQILYCELSAIRLPRNVTRLRASTIYFIPIALRAEIVVTVGETDLKKTTF